MAKGTRWVEAAKRKASIIKEKILEVEKRAFEVEEKLG